MCPILCSSLSSWVAGRSRKRLCGEWCKCTCIKHCQLTGTYGARFRFLHWGILVPCVLYCALCYHHELQEEVEESYMVNGVRACIKHCQLTGMYDAMFRFLHWWILVPCVIYCAFRYHRIAWRSRRKLCCEWCVCVYEALPTNWNLWHNILIFALRKLRENSLTWDFWRKATSRFLSIERRKHQNALETSIWRPKRCLMLLLAFEMMEFWAIITLREHKMKAEKKTSMGFTIP